MIVNKQKIDCLWQIYLSNKTKDNYDNVVLYIKSSENILDKTISSKHFAVFEALFRFWQGAFTNKDIDISSLASELSAMSNSKKTLLGEMLWRTVHINEYTLADMMVCPERRGSFRNIISVAGICYILNKLNCGDNEKFEILYNVIKNEPLDSLSGFSISGTSIYDASFIRVSGGGEYFYLISAQSPIDAIFFPKQELLIKSDLLRYEVLGRLEKLVKSLPRDLDIIKDWSPTTDSRIYSLIRDRRPYHVLADELSGHYYNSKHEGLDDLVPLIMSRSAFVENQLIDTDLIENERLQKYVFKKLVVSSYKRLDFSTAWANDYREWMVKLAIEEYGVEVQGRKSKDPIFWVGISGGEKRSWNEETVSLILIVNHLKKVFPRCTFIFDGWTKSGTKSSESDVEMIASHIKIMKEIIGSCGLKQENILSVIGEKVFKKIAYASFCEFFVACAGTPALWPSLFNRVPGVVHNSTRMINRVDNTMFTENVAKVPNRFIDDKADKNVRWDKVSYSIKPRVFLEIFLKSFYQFNDLKTIGEEGGGVPNGYYQSLVRVALDEASKKDFYNSMYLSVQAQNQHLESYIEKEANEKLKNYRNLPHLLVSPRFFGKRDVKILYEEEDSYRIIDCNTKLNSDTLFITFGKVSSNVDHIPFAYPFLTNSGFKHLHIAQRKRSSYQKLSYETLEKLLSSIVSKYKYVFTYGVSLGGYAAIYYSGAFNAKAIAASPRLPIHPLNLAYKDILWEPNSEWDETEYCHKSLIEVPRSKYDPLIIYDNLDQIDGNYVNKEVLKVYPGSILKHVESSGHGSLKKLSEAGILKATLLDCINQHVSSQKTEA